MDIKDVTGFIKTEEIDLSEYFEGYDPFVKLREPTIKEFSGLMDGANDAGAGDEVFLNNFLKLLPSIIVDHNFTKGGDANKRAGAGDVAVILEKKVNVIMKLTEIFQELIPLEKATPKK